MANRWSEEFSVMKNITKFIEIKLGLKENVSKSKVEIPENIKYLGFDFYSTNAIVVEINV